MKCNRSEGPFIQHMQTANVLGLSFCRINNIMVRMPEARSCFLSQSTENAPKPADLARLLVSLYCCKVKVTEIGPSLLSPFCLHFALYYFTTLLREGIMLYNLAPNSNRSVSDLAHGKSFRSLGVILKEILPFQHGKMFGWFNIYIMYRKFEFLNPHDTAESI